MTRRVIMGIAVLLLSAGVASADLTVNYDLGTLAYGSTTTLTGDTTGMVNNCDYYGVASWIESGPEFVYQFTLLENSILSIPTNAYDGIDHDQFLLDGLTTYESEGAWYTDGLAFVDETGTFDGIWGPGTYYLSVDGYNGAEGTFNFDLFVEQYAAPEPPAATAVNVPSQVDGTLDAGAVDWYSFSLTETLDLDINTLLSTGIGDTELGLYDVDGNLIASNDDWGGGGYLSQILATLDAGDYYVALGGYNTTFGSIGWQVDGGTATGDYTLQIVPEPAALVLIGLGALTLIRRR